MNKHALSSVTQWIERQPANQKVTGSIPSDGVAGQVPSKGRARGTHTAMFLSLSFFLPPPL